MLDEIRKNLRYRYITYLLIGLTCYRFSAFWLRSKCSICSYQLNIWYEGHRPSSILNWFLDGDRVSAACCGSIMCWPCIAVPQGTAHFPIKTIRINEFVVSISILMMTIYKSWIDLWSCYPMKQHTKWILQFWSFWSSFLINRNIFCIMNAYFILFRCNHIL